MSTARRTRTRYAVSLALLPLVPLLSGCGDTSAVVYSGASVSAPPVPEPLWTVGRAGRPSGTRSPAPDDPPERPEPLPGLTLPAGSDARALDPRDVVATDPDVTEESQEAVAHCRPGCGLRTPVLRDLTGDGRQSLILLIDPDPGARGGTPGRSGPQTELYAYRVDGGRVYQVLGLGIEEDSRVDLQGRDLLVRQTLATGSGDTLGQVSTSLYRWSADTAAMELVSRVTVPVPNPGKTP